MSAIKTVIVVLLLTIAMLPLPMKLSCTEDTKDSRIMESFERRRKSTNLKKEEQKKTRIVFTYAPEISWLDFRVGRINESIRHPRDPEILYVQKIDIGQKTLKTAITGFASPIDPETLRDKLVIVLVNMRQELDQSVLAHVRMMCARKGNLTEVLTPPKNCTPGDLVEMEGVARTPVDTLNNKKKLFHRMSIHFMTNDKRQATYKGTFLWFVRNKGVIVAPTLTDAYIK